MRVGCVLPPRPSSLAPQPRPCSMGASLPQCLPVCVLWNPLAAGWPPSPSPPAYLDSWVRDLVTPGHDLCEALALHPGSHLGAYPGRVLPPTCLGRVDLASRSWSGISGASACSPPCDQLLSLVHMSSLRYADPSYMSCVVYIHYRYIYAVVPRCPPRWLPQAYHL